MNHIDQLAQVLDDRYMKARSTGGTAPNHSCGCKARHLAERMLQSQGSEWESAPSAAARNVLLLHGTTAAAANRIRENQQFAPHQTFFAMRWKNRDLARIFAHRASSRNPRGGGP